MLFFLEFGQIKVKANLFKYLIIGIFSLSTLRIFYLNPMRPYEHILDQVKANLDFSSGTLTHLRKTIINRDWDTFEELFTLALSSSEYSHVAKSIVTIAPRYLSNQENITKFQKYIDYLQVGKKSSESRLVLQMSSVIMNNPHLPALYKFKILEISMISTACLEKLTTKCLDVILEEFAKVVDDAFFPNPYTGMFQIIFEALGRKDFQSHASLSHCLQSYLAFNRSTPNERYLNEDFIKRMVKSPILHSLSNDVLNEALTCWKQLESDTAQKFLHNQHHQTKKRLTRLQDSYLIMKDLFRNSLENRSDMLSKLDSLLMG